MGYNGNRIKKFKRDISKIEMGFFEAQQASKKMRKSAKYKEIKHDSDERKLIRDIVEENALNGMKKLEILVLLNNKFPDSKNSKYFATWIEYYFEKLKIKEDNSEEIEIE